MRRRELMLLLGGALTSAHSLRAQQKTIPVIGFLNVRSPSEAISILTAFRQGLSETGWVEGQSVAIEYRWAEGRYDRLPGLAADLVARKVNVITTGGLPPTRAAKHVTSTIPIVFQSTDPVREGLVASLAHHARPVRRRSGGPTLPTRSAPCRSSIHCGPAMSRPRSCRSARNSASALSHRARLAAVS